MSCPAAIAAFRQNLPGALGKFRRAGAARPVKCQRLRQKKLAHAGTLKI
jgi:hypothetical protein